MPGYGDDRTLDLPELIAQTQKETELKLPEGASLLPRYLGMADTLEASTDAVSYTQLGPRYYCWNPGQDSIRASFWVASDMGG